MAKCSQKPIIILKHTFRAKKKPCKHHIKSTEWYLFINFREGPCCVQPSSKFKSNWLFKNTNDVAHNYYKKRVWLTRITLVIEIFNICNIITKQKKFISREKISKPSHTHTCTNLKQTHTKSSIPKWSIECHIQLLKMNINIKLSGKYKKTTRRNTSHINCRLTYCTASTSSAMQNWVECTEKKMTRNNKREKQKEMWCNFLNPYKATQF